MVLDTSALIAVLFKEPAGKAVIETIEARDDLYISAATFLETSMVLSRFSRSNDVAALLQVFVDTAGITVLPFTREHALVAVEAFSRYGRGNHPASLNFGDCMTYATAKLAGMPLLFIGDDFSRTDLKRSTSSEE